LFITAIPLHSLKEKEENKQQLPPYPQTLLKSNPCRFRQKEKKKKKKTVVNLVKKTIVFPFL